MDAASRNGENKRAIAPISRRALTPASRVARGIPLAAFVSVILAISFGVVASGPAMIASGVAVLAALVGAQLWRRSVHAGVVRELLAAQDELLRDDIASAEARMARVLAARAEPINRAEAVAMLGGCAVRRGDFERAAACYESTLAIVPTNRVTSIDAFHLASIARAQRAFALAVAGRLDQADEILKLPALAGAHPAARALAIRSEAVLLHRRGATEALRALIAANRAVIQNFLTQRERTLLHVLEALAERTAAEPVAVPRELAPWIEAVAPEAASAMVPV